MKVKELIEELQKLDPEADLYTNDTAYGYNPIEDVQVSKRVEGFVIS